jgi:diguanylate cyclase (GGDEF)-like protein/PAS domain S-box-containing protein
VVAALSITRDVTDRRRVERMLRESEARYRTLVEGLPAITYLAALDDPSTLTLYVSLQVEPMLGYSAAEWSADGALWVRALHPEDRDRVMAAEAHAQATGEPFVAEYRLLARDGRVLWFHDEAVVVRDDAGRPRWYQGVMLDITARKQAEVALAHQALHDALTGLPNRRLLEDRLQQALLAAQRDGDHVAILLLDLARFRTVNDALGHDTGDQVLREVGRRLIGVVRAADTVARIAGDEFAVLLPRTDAVGAALATDKLLEALAQALVVAGQALHLEAQVGIAASPEHGRTTEDLLRNAQVALHGAKRSGSPYVLYTGSFRTDSLRQLALLGELRAAIERQQLVLHYQPKVSCRSGALLGVEALVRWPHPTRGLVPPGEFIPLAEQTALIQPLTRWVLGAALRQVRTWKAAGRSIPVAVNLSTRNLHDPGLAETVAHLLGDWEVPPDHLALEITETAVVADPERARRALAELRGLGVRLGLDDFGSGYSSLGRLKQLAMDELKIDREFVKDMATDADDAAITRAAIELGHQLGLEVVAEGVEDQPTWSLLRDLGCNGAQGYYLSRPRPPDELETWSANLPWPT